MSSDAALEALNASIKTLLAPPPGTPPLVARAVRWSNIHARTLRELRLCNAVIAWTGGLWKPIARITFPQLVEGMAMADGRYSRQQARLLVNAALEAGIIRRIASRGRQASLYRLGLVDELLAQHASPDAAAALATLRALESSAQPAASDAAGWEQPAARTAAGWAERANATGSTANPATGSIPVTQPAAQGAAHRVRRGFSKEREGALSHASDDDGACGRHHAEPWRRLSCSECDAAEGGDNGPLSPYRVLPTARRSTKKEQRR